MHCVDWCIADSQTADCHDTLIDQIASCTKLTFKYPSEWMKIGIASIIRSVC